jgi:hypothetical protein
MAGRKKLSLKQKKWAQEFVVNNGNATQAAVAAYPDSKSRGMAAVLGFKNAHNPEVIQEVEKLMEEQNITDAYMMRRLKEGLDANVVASHKGEVVLTKIPDLMARFKYWEAGAKIKNYFPAQQTESRNLNIDVQLENMPKAEFVQMLKEYLKEVNQDLQNVDVNKKPIAGE